MNSTKYSENDSSWWMVMKIFIYDFYMFKTIFVNSIYKIMSASILDFLESIPDSKGKFKVTIIQLVWMCFFLTIADLLQNDCLNVPQKRENNVSSRYLNMRKWFSPLKCSPRSHVHFFTHKPIHSFENFVYWWFSSAIPNSHSRQPNGHCCSSRTRRCWTGRSERSASSRGRETIRGVGGGRWYTSLC